MGREMLRFWLTDGKGRDGRERDGRGEALCCPNAGRWIGANARRRFCKSSFRCRTTCKRPPAFFFENPDLRLIVGSSRNWYK